VKIGERFRATQSGQYDLVLRPNLLMKLPYVFGLHHHDEIIRPEGEFIHPLCLVGIKIKIHLPAILNRSWVSREPYAAIKTTGICFQSQAPGIVLPERAAADVATANKHHPLAGPRCYPLVMAIGPQFCETPMPQIPQQPLFGSVAVIYYAFQF
jgi:hypothetical protein